MLRASRLATVLRTVAKKNTEPSTPRPLAPLYLLPIALSVAAVILVIGAFIALGRAEIAPTSSTDTAAVVAAVTGVAPATFDAVGTGGLSRPLKAIDASTVASGSGRLLVTYVGAEYCPFCASERWSHAAALSRFGVFGNLTLTRSSSTDVYPSTATFDFRGSSYGSDFIQFALVETADREGRPVELPDLEQRRALDRFDPNGSIPLHRHR